MRILQKLLWHGLLFVVLTISLGVIQIANPAILKGYIENSNVEGRIGVRIGLTGGVSHVYQGSPAEQGGIRKGDIVILVDGKPRNLNNIIGTPDTYVALEIRRGEFVYRVEIPRIDYRTIQYGK